MTCLKNKMNSQILNSMEMPYVAFGEMKKEGDYLVCRAIPYKRKDVIDAKMFLEWKGKWCVFIEGKHFEHSNWGNFGEASYEINFSVAKKLSEFFEMNCCYDDKNKFVKIISRLSPEEMMSISKLCKKLDN